MDNIDKLVHTPTSDKYILSKINTNIVPYSKLKNYKHIDELLKNDSVIILYELAEVGHWVCIVRRKKTLSYFDSYGREPDPDSYMEKMGCYPHLSRILCNSTKYILEYNEYNYQRKNVATCGHHAIVRILFKNEPLEKYQHFMAQFTNDDEVVTAISEML